jgi:hypothetical protein
MDVPIIPVDTSPEAAQVQVEIFRRMVPSRRLQLALEMGDSLRALVAAGIQQRHPEYAPQQVRLALIRLTLGKELFQKAFPGKEIAV